MRVQNIEALRLLSELAKLLDSLLIELNLLKVGANASGGDGLGNNDVVVEGGPGKDDLGRSDLLALGLAEALSDSLDLGSVNEERLAPAVVAEGGVGSEEDTLLLEVLDKLRLRKAGVALDLVHGGGDASVLDDLLKLVNSYHLLVEVRDTNGANLLLGQLGDGLPGLGEGHLLVKSSLAVIALLQWEKLVSVLESNRPVDQPELQNTKLLEGVVKSTSNLLRAVLVVPKLSGDEDVLTLKARDLAEGLLDTLTNLTLVLVDLGKIEVTVASLKGLVDTIADLTGSSLPCAVADLGDLPARVESDSSTERHDCSCF
ncbi:hypothetical protein HG531_000460 [Fusarium graminearum]|nr:hypothetical protein HG531_000460 [Fusarium graminearum]